MNEDQEFRGVYLDDLCNYVIPIVDRARQLGSGILVSIHGRHFVATAKHCIEDGPRAMRSAQRVQKLGVTDVRHLRIIRQGVHDKLDIGYLEIEDPECGEIGWNQLSDDRIVSGRVHVVGYPTVLLNVDLANLQMSLCPGVFSTTLVEETPDHLKFDYPKQGHRFDDVSGNWSVSQFPETPHGFSGGGCFGVTRSTDGGIEVVNYKLLAIQSTWHGGERWVKAIRIKQWCDLMREHGHHQG